jgi:hypothetical protein
MAVFFGQNFESFISHADNFNRADNVTVGSWWSEVSAGAAARIYQNKLYFPSLEYTPLRWQLLTTTPAQWQRITISYASGSNHVWGFLFRIPAASGPAYYVSFQNASNIVRWGWVTNHGTFAGDFSYTTGTLPVTSTHSYGVTISGQNAATVIRIWMDIPPDIYPSNTRVWAGDQFPDLVFETDPSTPLNDGLYLGLFADASVVDTFFLDDWAGGSCDD